MQEDGEPHEKDAVDGDVYMCEQVKEEEWDKETEDDDKSLLKKKPLPKPKRHVATPKKPIPQLPAAAVLSSASRKRPRGSAGSADVYYRKWPRDNADSAEVHSVPMTAGPTAAAIAAPAAAPVDPRPLPTAMPGPTATEVATAFAAPTTAPQPPPPPPYNTTVFGLLVFPFHDRAPFRYCWACGRHTYYRRGWCCYAFCLRKG